MTGMGKQKISYRGTLRWKKKNKVLKILDFKIHLADFNIKAMYHDNNWLWKNFIPLPITPQPTKPTI